MKASFLAAAAALVSSAVAAPAGVLPLPTGLTKGLGDIAKNLNLAKLPQVANAGDLAKLLHLPAPPTSSSAPIASDGHIVQDLGPQVNNILLVTGPDVQDLLIQLSPEVTALVSGLGLPELGVPLGSIVASASGLGDLLVGLGPGLDGLVTLVGVDVGALLIELSPEVAGLVSGLGLPGVGVPVGTVLATVGGNLKRDNPPIPTGKIIQDLAPQVQNVLTVTGPNAKQLLIELSPEVAALVDGLGLVGTGTSVGSIVATAANAGDLLKDISGPTKDLLTVTGDDGSLLLIQLSPSVAALVASLGLPAVGVPAGAVVATVGQNL